MSRTNTLTKLYDTKSKCSKLFTTTATSARTTVEIRRRLLVLGRFGPDGEEFSDHLQWHPLGLRDPQEDENPRDRANHGVNSEDARQPYRAQHHRERVGHDHIAYPEDQRTDGNAYPADPGRKDLRAEDVGDGPVSHHERAEVDHDADGGDDSVDDFTEIKNVPDYKSCEGDDQNRYCCEKQ